MTDEFDPEAYKTWTPAAQQSALERLQKATNERWRPFYCKNRLCDGKPHEEWTWNHARVDQRPPDDPDWVVWLLKSGRGAGKTRVGAEYTNRMTEAVPRLALVGATGADVRDIMLEGESGVLTIARPGNRPRYEPSKRRLTWPNGCIGTTFSAEEPDRLRGPEHGYAWCVAAGTPILMANGSNLPIEQVMPGDFVATRRGARPVTAIHDNGVRPVCRVVTDRGSLIATGDHRIAVPGGWRNVRDLAPGMICLAAWNDSTTDLRLGLNGEVVATTARGRVTTATPQGIFSTVMSTRRSTDPSTPSFTSITATRTRPTTIPRIWSRGNPENTAPGTTLNASPPGRTTSSVALPPARLRGRSGTTTLAARKSATNAAIPTGPATNGRRATARLCVHPARVVSVSLLPPRQVHDLTVADAHEFVAAGLVTHNCDEPAHWALVEDAWDNLLFGLRIGSRPRIVATTTPKPRKWLKELMKDPGTRLSTASTYANLDNLSPVFAERIIKKYEGTRLGRQELYAEILEDVEGALWSYALIDQTRVLPVDRAGLLRVVIAIDPAGSSRTTADETAIIAVGTDGSHIYVLADRSGHYTPHGWAMAATRLYEEWEADAIVAEINFGGEMVSSQLRLGGFAHRLLTVRAKVGKAVRAEPVVGLFEQGLAHLAGTFPELEAQLTEWVPYESRQESPDRLDAMVYGVLSLATRPVASQIASPVDLRSAVPARSLPRPPLSIGR